MFKFLKIGMIIGATVLNCITIFFLISMFFKFDYNVMALMNEISIIVIIISVLLLFTKVIVTKDTIPKNISILLNNIIHGLDVISLMIFFVYFICFAIQTKDIERGTDLYMRMMYPGIIPIISGILLRVSLGK